MSAPPIDPTSLRELCDLARLHVPQEREASVLARLQRVVAAFSRLPAVPPADAERSAPDCPELRPASLRVDEPMPGLDPATVFANAPRAAAGAFVVPRVVDS